MNVRQAVVVRRDLQMTPGLLAAQVAHLSAIFMIKSDGVFNGTQKQWFDGPVLSVLAVNIQEELDVLIKRAKDLDVVCHIWKDTIPSPTFSVSGKLYFLNVIVGVAFGPSDDELIKQVTGDLPLY